MSTRAHLLAVADALARRGASTLRGEQPLPDRKLALAAEFAVGAKAALEAAALVDADLPPIMAALERFDEHLAKIGVLDEDVGGLEPADSIDLAGRWVEQFHRESLLGAAVVGGYAALRELLEGLLRDFTAADTETSRRLAARIKQGLDDAAEAVEAAKRQEAPDGG